VNGPGQGDLSPLTVTSPDLAGGTFPREFTCDGANRLPRLPWSTPPPGTRELAVEMLDPDAPGGAFTQWPVYRIPPGITSLAAGPPGAAEGVSDFSRRGYGGPCPPRGAAHHYHFVVLALDTRPDLPAEARRPDLDARISGHVPGKCELVATYRRLSGSLPAPASPARPAAARSRSCSGADHTVQSTSRWQARV
jgi:hypothetical protein